jgi:hypothetical protein
MHRRILISIAALGLLAGCAGTMPDPTTPPVTATPSATPTPEPDPGPVVRVAADCEDFGDVAAISGLLVGADDVQLVTPEAGTAGTYLQQQYGTLTCRWAPGGELSPSQEVRVTVAPEITDAQWQQIVSIAGGGTGVVAGGFTGEAYSNCFGKPWGRFCRLDVRIDDWYLHVGLTSTEAAAEGVARKWGDPFMHKAVDIVAGLPAPSARWQPATSTPAPSPWSELIADGTLASDLGYDSIDIALVGPNTQSDALWIAADAVGYQIAYLQAVKGDRAQNFHVEVLPGGDWAWDSASAGGTPVPGIGDAAVRFSSASDATVLFRQGGDLVSATAEVGAPYTADPISGTDPVEVAMIAARHLAALVE